MEESSNGSNNKNELDERADKMKTLPKRDTTDDVLEFLDDKQKSARLSIPDADARISQTSIRISQPSLNVSQTNLSNTTPNSRRPSNVDTFDETPAVNPNYVPPAVSFEVGITKTDEPGNLQATAARNTFAAKKTVAQGMMDIALITANANQLRYIIEFNSRSSTYYLNLGLIIISLILQVCVGLALIFKARLDLKGRGKTHPASRLNNFVVIGVFLVTIINVFIASFTITTPAVVPPNSGTVPVVPQPPVAG